MLISQGKSLKLRDNQEESVIICENLPLFHWDKIKPTYSIRSRSRLGKEEKMNMAKRKAAMTRGSSSMGFTV